MATESFALEPEKRYGHRLKLFEAEERYGHRVFCSGTRKNVMAINSNCSGARKTLWPPTESLLNGPWDPKNVMAIESNCSGAGKIGHRLELAGARIFRELVIRGPEN